MYSVLLFDIDGTLIRSGGAAKNVIANVLKSKFGISLPIMDINFGGRTDQSLIKEIFHKNEIPLTAAAMEIFRTEYLNSLRTSMSQCHGEVLPGVCELLASVSDSSVAVGLLTGNIREAAFIKLGFYGLDSYFAFGGFGDDGELRGQIAEVALKRAEKYMQGSVAASEVLIIGDTPADVECARHIGVHCLAVATGYCEQEELKEAGPDHYWADLSDSKRFLSLLNTKY
tara:strand:- start:353 stop:1036 length:684 start_codon:yes stop_codon:yes gene_type:complete